MVVLSPPLRYGENSVTIVTTVTGHSNSP
jgi:hypothetical protein